MIFGCDPATTTKLTGQNTSRYTTLPPFWFFSVTD
jgi:hypothetical protein